MTVGIDKSPVFGVAADGKQNKNIPAGYTPPSDYTAWKSLDDAGKKLFSAYAIGSRDTDRGAGGRLTNEAVQRLAFNEKAASPFEEHLRTSGDVYAKQTWLNLKGPGGSSDDRRGEVFIDALAATKDVEGARAHLPNIDTIGKIANELKAQSKMAGTNFDNKAKPADWHFLRLAQNLADSGVSSIKTLRQTKDGWVDSKSGKTVISGNLAGAAAQGAGWTEYFATPDAQGRPVFYGSWESSSDKGKIAAGLGLVLNLVAPGAGSALGNAIGLSGGIATAVGGGLIQGGLAAAGGASGEGILRSALSAGAAPALAAIPGFSSLPLATQKIVAGAASGAIKSDSSKGALLGAVTGAIPSNMTGNAPIDRLLKAVIGMQVQKKVMKP